MADGHVTHPIHVWDASSSSWVKAQQGVTSADGLATAAKQDTSNASLANLDIALSVLRDALRGGSNKTLTDIVTALTGLVVQANAGTNLNTSALALEGGGNLAAIAANVATAAGQSSGNTALFEIATDTDSLTTAQGVASTSVVGPLVQGVVNDTVGTFNPTTVQPFQLSVDGRLRVVTASESYNLTPWGQPYAWGEDGEQDDAYPFSAW